MSFRSVLQRISLLIWLLLWASPQQASVRPVSLVFSKLLTFKQYTIHVVAPDSGSVREVAIQARRNDKLLIAYRVRVDQPVVGADLADLDGNSFPEVYLYLSSIGSGSFGQVVGWQFLANRLADVEPANWQLTDEPGYMGHDSLWTEGRVLCRRFPIYQPGDSNAQPSGGLRMLRYQLRLRGQNYVLERKKADREKGG